MADQTEERRDERLDEPDRSTPSRGVSLAEEGGDDLPALLVIAVGIAVIVVLLVWSGYDTTPTTNATSAVAAADDDHGDDEAHGDEADDGADSEDEGEAETAEPAAVDVDLAALGAAVGIAGVNLSADGGVVTATGEVADEAQRGEVIAALEGQPGVEQVIDELTIAAPAAAAPAVAVAASQASIVLEGTVPSEAVEAEMVARAAAIYADDQIDNRLVVDTAATPPVAVTVTGSITDPTLHAAVSSAFDGIDGVDSVDATGFVLEESSEVEASLNNLEPIQFQSGSDVFVPGSEPILSQAAEFLNANPELQIEIGGHTDSRGSDEANQALSQARADRVKAALEELGVTNQMDARGFGESRLKESPDDTAEAQQANRRIEFRITG